MILFKKMNIALKNLRKIAIIASIILLMTALTTSVMTLVSLAEEQTFLEEWLPVWARTALIIAPAGFVLLYIVDRIIDLVLPKARLVTRKAATSLGMSLLMTSVIAVITTLKLHGFTSAFITQWSKAMLAGIPVAIAVSALMIFVVKPRMDAILKP